MLARGGLSTASAFGFGGTAAPDSAFGPGPAQRAAPCESWTLTADQVERWLKSARVGEQLIYAHGPTLIDGAAAALVRKLGGDSVVHPFQRPAADGGRDYVARLLRVRTVRQIRAPLPRVDMAMLAVLTIFQEAAAEKRRCPGDAATAAATGLSERDVKYQVEKLRRDRLIETRTVAAPREPRFRIVRIVATGMETRGPE